MCRDSYAPDSDVVHFTSLSQSVQHCYTMRMLTLANNCEQASLSSSIDKRIATVLSLGCQ